MKKTALFISIMAALLLSCGRQQVEPRISVGGKTTFSIGYNAQRVTVDVTCNVSDWTYDLGEGASWMGASRSAEQLLLDVAENASGLPRRAVVTLKAGSSSVNVVVMQATLEPMLDLDCGKTLKVGAAAGYADVEVETNMDSWGFETSASWFSVSRSGNTLRVVFEENTADEVRRASVKVFAPESGNTLIRRSFDVEQAEAEIEYETESLSAGGPSNSYLISRRGKYSFDATVRGNGKTVTGLSEPEPLAPAKARLVWQSAKGMIKSVGFDPDAGEIVFEVSKTNGNALIAALDGSGAIIWSWHIWFPSREPQPLNSISGEKVMDMNLGAMDMERGKVSSYGLLYQWGRKDPFPGSPLADNGSITTVNSPVYDIDGNSVGIGHSSMYSLTDNNLAYSIANPTVCISNNSQFGSCRDWLRPVESNTALWGNPRGSERSGGNYPNKGSKTYYDPCPPGWRVPPPSTFSNVTKSGGMAWASGESHGVLVWGDLGGETTVEIVDIDGDGQVNLSDYENGWTFYLDKGRDVYSYFPATTRYDGQYAMLMGSMVGLWGNYWNNSPSLNGDGTDSYLGNCLSYGIKEYGSTGPQDNYTITLSPLSNGSRADAYAIRCVRE